MSKVKIVSFCINFSDGDKYLSVEEAKQLYDQLDKLFGEKAPLSHPYPVPVIIERERLPNPYWTYEPKIGDPVPQYPLITCCATEVPQ